MYSFILLYILSQSKFQLIRLAIQLILLLMNSTFQNQTFVVVKFQPHDIVLMDKFTRKLYSYHDQPSLINSEIDHEIILKCQTLSMGLIHQKEITSLAKIVQNRITKSIKQSYQEQQLNNTFQPILHFLQNGFEHGAISLQNILIDINGNIRLKDPRISQQQNQFTNDFQRLGFTILQCAVLQDGIQLMDKKQSITKLVHSLTRYSDKFIANVWILLNCMKELIPQISLCQKQPNDGKYNQLIKQIGNLRKNNIRENINIEVLKSLEQKQEKKIIVIPSLNLKFMKEKQRGKGVYSAKKAVISNQNMNMENAKSNKVAEKTVNFKCFNKNKKLQMMDNYKNILKKKGKTLDKKIK